MEIQKMEGKIGTIGIWSESIDDKGVVRLSVGVEIDIVGELKKLAMKTETPIDDAALAWVETMLLKAKA